MGQRPDPPGGRVISPHGSRMGEAPLEEGWLTRGLLWDSRRWREGRVVERVAWPIGEFVSSPLGDSNPDPLDVGQRRCAWATVAHDGA